MVKTKKSLDSPRHLFAKNSVTNTQRTILISTPSALKVVEFLLTESGHHQMALHFVGKKKISELHQLYFDDPSPTDCITFPYEDESFLGEIFVCPAIAKEYVEMRGGDLFEEITLYVVHGFCHLLGFDDQSEEDRKAIRKEEKKWLQKLAKNKLRITP